MGFRTVLVLSNDQSHLWENDPELGKKIFESANGPRGSRFEYGTIVEQVHADCQTLIVADKYEAKSVCSTSWYRTQTDAERDLDLLKKMAAKLGYKISKPRKVVTPA